MGRYYDVEVVHTEMLTSHAKRVDIRRVDGEPFAFRAGQFLMIWFERDGKRQNRSYSVASPISPGEPVDTLELCIALIDGGIGSTMVQRWAPGSTFTISGPHGRFVLREEDRDVVLVGTGTGIAPYRSMLPQLDALLASGRSVDLVFGARDESQFLYDEDWNALGERHGNFGYWRCADEATDPDRWAAGGGVVGRVQVALQHIEGRTAQAVFYLCGNPAMVDDVKEQLEASGVERTSIRTEAYVSPVVPG